jgi:hypothetical protein
MYFTAKFLTAAEVTEEGDTQEGSFRGMPIVIENKKGTIREGTDPDGNEWSITMTCDYGFIPGTEAAGDKEGLDVFIGPDENSEFAYVVEQLKEDGSFDEFKVVLGAPDLQTAEEMYLSNYEEGWDQYGEIYETPIDELFEAVKRHQK